ncbi:MAG: hypothetical protein WD035_04835, partial [Balneolaceae bacterium]
WDYSQESGDKSITGGFVYRGSALPGLAGKYIYADFVSMRMWALDSADLDHPVNSQLLQVNFGISSFGVDAENELYICGFDGKIHRLEEI